MAARKRVTLNRNRSILLEALSEECRRSEVEHLRAIQQADRSKPRLDKVREIRRALDQGIYNISPELLLDQLLQRVSWPDTLNAKYPA